MIEQMKMSCRVKVTAQNIKHIRTVTPDADAEPGDTYNCVYTVDVAYLGRVAECFEAMIALGSERSTVDHALTETLLKRLMRVFTRS